MSTSGFREHGSDGVPRRPWQAPVLSVLVFRATAAGGGTSTDAEGGAPLSPPPPPPPPSPPPPPPPTKGNFFCEGATFVGAGGTSNTPVTVNQGTIKPKHNGSNIDINFPHNSTLCQNDATLALT